jgi:hypothetical protein
VRPTTEERWQASEHAAGTSRYVGDAAMIAMMMAAGPAVVADAPRGPLFADPGHLAETGPAALGP